MTTEPDMVQRVSQALAGELFRRGFMSQLEDGLRLKPDIDAIARAAIEAMMEPHAPDVQVGLTMVRIDTSPGEDGWCFCTPQHHPDDIRRGFVEGEWNDSAQMFSKVLRSSLKEGEGK